VENQKFHRKFLLKLELFVENRYFSKRKMFVKHLSFDPNSNFFYRNFNIRIFFKWSDQKYTFFQMHLVLEFSDYIFFCWHRIVRGSLKNLLSLVWFIPWERGAPGSTPYGIGIPNHYSRMSKRYERKNRKNICFFALAWFYANR